MRLRWIATIALLAACGRSEAGIPGNIQASVANTARVKADRQHDADRKPAEVLAFIGIKPGMKVGELMAGSGYYTELLSAAVGKDGAVFAHNPPYGLDESVALAWQQRTLRLGKQNVVALEGMAYDPGFPSNLDVVVLISSYHDLHWQEVDLRDVNTTVFESLTPGGIYAIADYRAKDGTKDLEAMRLHRIEAEYVKQEVLAAGFVFAGSSDVLSVATDKRKHSIYADSYANGDKADRFLFRFRKP